MNIAKRYLITLPLWGIGIYTTCAHDESRCEECEFGELFQLIKRVMFKRLNHHEELKNRLLEPIAIEKTLLKI